MRKINVKKIEDAIAKACEEANYSLSPDVLTALKRSIKMEKTSIGRDTLKALIENAKIAKCENIPICQDTGTAVIFISVGQEVHLIGGDLNRAIQRGVRKGYRFLRKSLVRSPLTRENTKDNTPAIIHTEIVPGSKVHIIVSPKGAGSENQSALKMFKPSDDIRIIKDFIIGQVKKAGASACPPMIIGVGIGGNFEEAPLLAKKALLRYTGTSNKNKKIAALEKEILKEINKTNIGPSGFGGKVTALAVNIADFPCHIASLPVAVNIGCHANRHKEIVI
ncbi:MAG: fumarate hydratase [bacterium]